jgi:hypothetical protein
MCEVHRLSPHWFAERSVAWTSTTSKQPVLFNYRKILWVRICVIQQVTINAKDCEG